MLRRPIVWCLVWIALFPSAAAADDLGVVAAEGPGHVELTTAEGGGCARDAKVTFRFEFAEDKGTLEIGDDPVFAQCGDVKVLFRNDAGGDICDRRESDHVACKLRFGADLPVSQIHLARDGAFTATLYLAQGVRHNVTGQLSRSDL